MMNLTYGSVCSGIEAATVAWHQLGWKPSWFSQFDPEHDYNRGLDFPSKVLAARYPSVDNLGDMTRIADYLRFGEVDAPDVLVGGTPCQAFSLAGLRGGLSDTRGQLTLKYVELADQIDSEREGLGKQKSIIVWENVPGVLNTGDNAFGCFIAALSGCSEELNPPEKRGGVRVRWPNSGCVIGPTRTVAWRVLDAQYFGLAQRRKRLFVVASARDDFNPVQVFLEREGVRRDSAPLRDMGEEVAGTIAANSFLGGAGGRVDGAAQGHFRVVEPYCMAHGQAGAEISVGDRPTLTCNHEAPIAFNWNAQPDQLKFDQISSALTCSQQSAVHSEANVRRLLPIECERLQGFDDRYTQLSDDCPDGHRYKALGNSMAVPVMRWIGRRIEFALTNPWCDGKSL